MAARQKNRLDLDTNGAAQEQTPAPPPEVVEKITIPRIEPKIMILKIVGITPLMVCAWSVKAREQMLAKQMKKAKQGREAKNPEECYRNSLYTSTDGWTGIPAGGVKGCIVNACRATDVPMTLAKRMIFVRAQGMTSTGQELVRVYGEHQMHEGMVRIDNGGTCDIRFRAIYPKWRAEIEVEYLGSVISAQQVANLVELAGYIEGLCEHRPGSPKSNTGNFGRFVVTRDD
jgi:hypothetical protein